MLTGLRPRAGQSGGGTLLRLRGFGFDAWDVTNFTQCRFGAGAGAVTTPLVARTSTTLKCLTPAHAPGTVAVSLALTVLRKGPCVFDLVLISPPDGFDSSLTDYRAFVDGFEARVLRDSDSRRARARRGP